MCVVKDSAVMECMSMHTVFSVGVSSWNVSSLPFTGGGERRKSVYQ